MIKPTPNIKKRIAYYANQLPAEWTETGIEDSLWDGSDLMLTGISEVEGKPINPDGKYNVPMPVNHRVNHEERMLTAYKKDGKSGVFNYLEKYVRSNQEFVNALRHEIFTSGNFEPYSFQEQYEKSWSLINKSMQKLSETSLLCKRVDDQYSKEADELGDKIISYIADTKSMIGIKDEHKKALDAALNTVYKTKSKVLKIKL